MGTNDAGEAFEISIGNTDNDPRERAALSANWPNIFLILCMFHVWQAWRNGLNRFLKSVPKGDGRKEVRKRLGRLLMRLLKTTTEHTEALEDYANEIAHFKQLRKQRSPLKRKQAVAALKFLVYLKSYVENKSYWMSWSPAGPIASAKHGLTYWDFGDYFRLKGLFQLNITMQKYRKSRNLG
ncbi:hypothetical protein BD779DRAFT_1675636 [Infundibulicybe gibba]|nr:hypothetical protein BD779DRAFT_1675636 [Infundibulicybe gibba]